MGINGDWKSDYFGRVMATIFIFALVALCGWLAPASLTSLGPVALGALVTIWWKKVRKAGTEKAE